MTEQNDKRPAPKPRKNPELWQSYLWWWELMDLRRRHTLRISSIEREKSNLKAQFERDMLEMFKIDEYLEFTRKTMIEFGKQVGPIWDWLVGIKGVGDASAAKLLAQFDDVGTFATVSKFWRFSGWGMADYWLDKKGKVVAPKAGYKWTKNEDGGKEKIWTVPEPQPDWTMVTMIDRCLEGWHSPYNRVLKAEIWVVVGNFLKQQTPLYADLYYEEKERQRKEHPEKEKRNGKTFFNDGHIHNRAIRKVAKIFLQHLWVTWRGFEGLPVSEPWVIAHRDGHNRLIEPITS